MASQTARNCCSYLAFLSLAILPDLARAGEPDEFATPIPITAPWHTPRISSADAPPPQAAGEWLLYINFDGGQMNWCGWGNDTPQGNCSTIMQDTVLPFSGDANKRAAVVQVIRGDFKDLGVRVTDIRPQSGDYDMEMIGDWDPAPGGGFAGVAPSLDCFNKSGGEVSFTLDYTGSATGIAKAALQEAAHTWGLEHVESKGDLLYPTTESVMNPTFENQCFQIVQIDNMGNPFPDSAVCKTQHSQFCPTNQQNSFRDLLQIFGPHVPDLTAPTIQITSPAEGAVLESNFDIVIKAADEQSPQVLSLGLELEGPVQFSLDPSNYASPADLTFPVKGLVPGDFTVTATVTDEEANMAVATLHFTVMAPAPSTTSGATTDEPTGGGATGGATGDAGTDGDTSGGTGADTGQTPGGDEGCNCQTTDPPAALAFLALLGLARARRRQRA